MWEIYKLGTVKLRMHGMRMSYTFIHRIYIMVDMSTNTLGKNRMIYLREKEVLVGTQIQMNIFFSEEMKCK